MDSTACLSAVTPLAENAAECFAVQPDTLPTASPGNQALRSIYVSRPGRLFFGEN